MPLTGRQVTDPVHLVGVHADMDELFQPAVRSDDAERAVPGVHQIAGGLHDVPEHHRQAQLAGDHRVRPQQPPQPALRGQHVLRPVGQLPDQLVQRQPRRIRKGQVRIRCDGRHCPRARSPAIAHRLHAVHPSLRHNPKLQPAQESRPGRQRRQPPTHGCSPIPDPTYERLQNTPPRVRG